MLNAELILATNKAAHAHLLGLEERDIESAESTNFEKGGNASGVPNESNVEDFSMAAFGLPDSSKVSAQVFLICSLLHLLVRDDVFFMRLIV